MNPESVRGDSGQQNVDESFWASLFAEEEANPTPPETLNNLSLEDDFILDTTDQIKNASIPRPIDPWTVAQEAYDDEETLSLTVTGFNKGGLLVEWHGLPGFVPASHLSELTPGMSDRKRQQKLAKLRTEKLPVKIIEVDRRRRRLVFSQRDAQKEWEEKRKGEMLESLNEGDVLTGRVSGLRDFGIFVDIGGADGLVHISELAWHRIDHPREVVKVGDEIEVVVLKLDRKEQRISLSRKKVLANPWDTVEERYELNQLVEGTVTRILDYGAFAEIEPGIEGLLHVSQLSRTNVENVAEVVKEGETHLLRVVSIDPQRQRIGLSLKAVTAQEQIEWMEERMAQEEAAAELVEEIEEAVIDEIIDEEAVAAVDAAIAVEAIVAEEEE